MKIFVTGINGQLGYDLRRELLKRGHSVAGADVRTDAGSADLTLDITDEEAVSDAVARTKPDAVIHCAAWTAVDAAEGEANKEKVYAVNVKGTANIAKAAAEPGIPVMYISTDYVYDGSGTEARMADDRNYAPLNYYGETKLEGERILSETVENYFIVRISWVFGINGNNFVKAIMNAARTHDELRVVNDQIGSPTYTKHLAVLLADMIESKRFGYYNATNEGEFISWYEFACEIVKQAGTDTKIIPVSTEEYGLSAAERPKNSRLDKSKLKEAGFEPLPHWRDALADYIAEVKENGSN